MEKVKMNKGNNKIYVPSGCYNMEVITTDATEMTIDELGYLIVKSGKGEFITMKESKMIDDDYLQDFYTYVDLSAYNTHNGYIKIYPFDTYNVEVRS